MGTITSDRRWRTGLLAMSCALLSACAGLATMPDGRTTSLDEATVAERFARPISTTGVAAMPEYQAGLVCAYTVRTHLDAGGVPWTWTTRAVRDRILVQKEGPYPEPSTLLIGADGELFDFNVIDDMTGERQTAENYQARANAQMAANPGARIINTVELGLPHLQVSAAGYGDVVSRVLDSGGEVWAQFIYAGSTTYRGRPAVVLDLVRVMPTMGNRPVVVGYTVMDAATALPLVSTLRLGSRYHLEQRGCDGAPLTD